MGSRWWYIRFIAVDLFKFPPTWSNDLSLSISLSYSGNIAVGLALIGCHLRWITFFIIIITCSILTTIFLVAIVESVIVRMQCHYLLQAFHIQNAYVINSIKKFHPKIKQQIENRSKPKSKDMNGKTHTSVKTTKTTTSAAITMATTKRTCNNANDTVSRGIKKKVYIYAIKYGTWKFWTKINYKVILILIINRKNGKIMWKLNGEKEHYPINGGSRTHCAAPSQKKTDHMTKRNRIEKKATLKTENDEQW